jgi:hypothetical protein
MGPGYGKLKRGSKASLKFGLHRKKRKCQRKFPVPDLAQAITALEIKRDSINAVIQDLNLMLLGGRV